jgi:hypothetical protein
VDDAMDIIANRLSLQSAASIRDINIVVDQLQSVVSTAGVDRFV